MPLENAAPGSPDDWLARARGDLALARLPLPPDGFYEDLCFHAQQAAEKSLKAVYLRNGWPFRFVHDLEELITGLRKHGLVVPTEVDAAVILTSYASESRYPGLGEPVTDDERLQAVALADAVVRWAAGKVSP